VLRIEGVTHIYRQIENASIVALVEVVGVEGVTHIYRQIDNT
jgi:hypothetical protein